MNPVHFGKFSVEERMLIPAFSVAVQTLGSFPFCSPATGRTQDRKHRRESGALPILGSHRKTTSDYRKSHDEDLLSNQMDLSFSGRVAHIFSCLDRRVARCGCCSHTRHRGTAVSAGSCHSAGSRRSPASDCGCRCCSSYLDRNRRRS